MCIAATKENIVWMYAALLQYLFKYQRGIEAIKGNGNCLFHALSRILHGNQDIKVLSAIYLLPFLPII